MYLRVQARAASDHSILTAAAEQLGHELLVRHRTGTAGSYPLVVPLQHGIGFGRIQILRRRTTFKRPQSPVFVHRQHHGCLTTKVNEVKLLVAAVVVSEGGVFPRKGLVNLRISASAETLYDR